MSNDAAADNPAGEIADPTARPESPTAEQPPSPWRFDSTAALPHGPLPYGQYPSAADYADGTASAPAVATAAGQPVDPPYGSPPAVYPPASQRPPRPKRFRGTLIATAIIAAVVGGGTGAATVVLTDSNGSKSVASGITVTTVTAQNSAAVTAGTVSSAAAKITPSVVTIQVTGSSESGTGSGVVLRSDGYILTNDHVVSVAADGGSISVETSDGRTGTATIVGRDTTDDLAVIKVSGLANLTAATFAKSSSLTVGQTVIAVGAPLGLSDTVTSGIISATARTVRSGDTDQAVFAAIQTDAAINPGNSGGALVDLNGNVIGINAAIATTSSSGVTVPGQTTQSGSIGIGFAIPSDEASRVAAELIATGKASHAVLGVTIQSSTATTSSTVSGATIGSVSAGGAASAAKLVAGDVVTAVDGTRIEDGDDLIAVIRAHAAKDTVNITFTRNGTSQTVKATLTGASS
ncbi:MAG: putative serine protease PepD [Pseudonocardiales bacterium]|nr:putative serine protease PepD [Pseudonocardiales bacterium]